MLQVPDVLIRQAGPFFDALDRDMDRGWQMSRDWVPSPDRLQRCQIVANKLLTALENANERLGQLMAGYILTRLPDVIAVELDTQGEIQNTCFTLKERPAEPLAPTRPPSAAGGLGKLQAMEQAGNEVAPVFKVGKGYRFAVLDRASNQWQDSPLFATESEATRQRQEAFKARFEELQRSSG
jgi:hypothetical protein